MTRFVQSTPAFPVRDLDASAAFYGRVCGHGVLARGDRFALLGRDGESLLLWLSDDEDWRGREGAGPVVSGAESFLAGTASCRVQVEGIEALHAEMLGHGAVHPNGGLARAEYPAWEFAILDPDGNLITFFEMDGAEG